MPGENESEWDPDRNHPLVTETDWGFLTVEGYFENHARPSQSRNQQRQNLRERLYNALLDFSILYERLSNIERERIFDFSNEDEVNPDELQLDWEIEGGFYGQDETIYAPPPLEFEQGLIDAVAFLWLAALDAGVSPKDLMETGIEQAYTRRHPEQTAAPAVELNASFSSIADRAARKMRAGDGLSDREVRALLEKDRKNPDDVAAYLRGDSEES